MAATQPPQPSQPPPTELASADQELSWEGDNMFNIYIYDYCYKRGYKKTARELLVEADIPPESQPPINARQGLLFEWWSVFWVLFTAKSNGTGTEEAMLYAQHQLQQNRQATQRMQPQTQVARYGSGAVPRLPGTVMSPSTNGQMSNGTGPPPGGHPGQSTLGFPMPTQSSNSQTNGISGSSTQPASSNSASGPHNPIEHSAPNVNQSLGHQNQSQLRPLASLGTAGQRPPFQSPTTANSPAGPNSQQGVAPGTYPGVPMGHLGMSIGPSPNLAQMNINRSGMLPHHLNGVGGGLGGGGGPQTPTQPLPSSSRSATPAQSQGPGMTQPSPSMAVRQAQTPTQPNFNVNNLGNIPAASRGGFEQLNAELLKIDGNMLTQLKNELGLESRDTMSLAPDDKSRIIQAARQRNASASTAGTNTPANRNQGQQGRPAKRNSTSPSDEAASLPKPDSSPRERKRVRQSPSITANDSIPHAGPSSANPNANPMHPFSGMSGQPMMSGPMRGAGPQVNGFPAQGHPSTPQLSNMSPGLMPHPSSGSGPQMMGPQMVQQPPPPYRGSAQYHQSMQQIHKIEPPFNPADSHRQGPPFVGGGLVPPMNPPGNNDRLGGPMNIRMMPPPSSVGNGMAKSNAQPSGQANVMKQESGGGPDIPNTSRMDGSPRTGPQAGPPNNGGTGPATPASGPSASVATPSPSQIPNNHRISPPNLNHNNPPRPATTTGNTNNNASGASAPPPPLSAPPVPTLPPSSTQHDNLSASLDFVGTFDDFPLFRDDLNFDEGDFSSWISNTDDVQLDFK